MTTYLLYNRQTAAERTMQSLAERLESVQVEAELLDADSPRGIQMVEHYDIMGRPAILIVRADGSPMQIWQGEDQLPPLNEIAHMARQ